MRCASSSLDRAYEMKTSRVSGIGHRVRHPEPFLRRSKHLLKARIVTDWIEIGIELDMTDPAGTVHSVEKRCEGIERVASITQLADHGAGEIVAHVQVIGIEKQR